MSTKDLDSLAQEIARYIKNVAPDNVVEQITGQSTKPDSFSEFKNKPIEFIQDVLGITLWEKQKEIARLFLDNRFVSIEAAHGVGKSFVAAALAAYWLCTNEDTALLVTSAPTASQVNSVLWRAMRQHKEHAKRILPGEIFLTPQWRISSDRQGIGLSPRKNSEFDVASLQGRHDPHLLVILDEAGGLTLPLWNATISLVTGEENKFLAIGNPVAKSGPFYESTRSQNFKSIRISCLEHPNVVQHKDIIPGSVSWDWVNERINDWCHLVSTPSQKTVEWNRKHYEPLPVFVAKVLGRPPDETESQLIFLGWVEAAIQRGMNESQTTGERVMGLDVAYGGSSESALAYRVGDALQWIKRNRLNDTTQITEWLKSEIDEHEVERAFIDTTGGYGCFDDQTEVLTDSGWKFFQDISDDEMVLSLDIDTKEVQYRKISEKIEYRYCGEMYIYNGKAVNFCVTPNHRMLYRGERSSQWKIDELQKIDVNYLRMLNRFTWHGQEIETFIIKGSTCHRARCIKSTTKHSGQKFIVVDEKLPDKVIPMDIWLEFLGWFLSEGFCCYTCKKYYVCITQGKTENIGIIRTLLEKIGYYFKEKTHAGVTTFSIISKSLYDEVVRYGHLAPNKTIPLYVGMLPPRQIQIFLDAFLLGDGYTRSRDGRRGYTTTSEKMANSLQELIIKSGGYAAVCRDKVAGSCGVIKGRVITRTSDRYSISEWKQKGNVVINKKLLKTIKYDGIVYCVNVEPFHTIFTRRHGKCIWAGNSATYDSLRNQGYPVEGINFAQAAMQRTKYTNMRCEMWWTVREVLRTGRASLPDDDFLQGDLVSPLHDHDNLGRVRIEDKDQIIKRLGRSPDSGDAYALSYAGASLESESFAENYVDDLTTKSIERESGGQLSRWSISGKRIGKSRWKF